MTADSLDGRFALELQGLQRLGHTARRDPGAGLEAAAEQFEALFLHRLLKSMREATPRSDLMNGAGTRFHRSLFDQQLAQHLAGRGIGLADLMTEQLSQGTGGKGRAGPAPDPVAAIPRAMPRPLPVAVDSGAARASAVVAQPEAGEAPGRREFLARLDAPARVASRRTGLPAELLVAQAALETGWGRHEIAAPDGGRSHNLFGIKAGAHWRGETAEVVTHEYLDGRRRRVVDRFRVYDSDEQALTDYGRLINGSPRYAEVAAAPDAAAAARALQHSGYATDPAYADKLIAVMESLPPVAEPVRVAEHTRPAGIHPKESATAADSPGAGSDGK